jgi:CO/xanthine dehydrogenase FAD-binding subunit
MFRRSLSQGLDQRSRCALTVEQVMRTPALAPAWIAALLALDAQVNLAGERQAMPLANFVAGRDTRHDRVAGIQVPPSAPGSVTGEAYYTCSDGAAPGIAVIAVVTLTEGFVRCARLALSGAGSEPARLVRCVDYLVGGPLTVRRIRHVAEHVGQEVCPPGGRHDHRASGRATARVLTYCALEQCWRWAYGT